MHTTPEIFKPTFYVMKWHLLAKHKMLSWWVALLLPRIERCVIKNVKWQFIMWRLLVLRFLKFHESPDKKSLITLAPNVIVDKLSFGILARAPFYSGKEQCRFFSFVVNFISALLGAFSSTLLSYILNVQSCRTKKIRSFGWKLSKIKVMKAQQLFSSGFFI